MKDFDASFTAEITLASLLKKNVLGFLGQMKGQFNFCILDQLYSW